jgi:SAM-dependent methyltransferase
LYDWLSQLGPSDRVLDVASARGSFSTRDLECAVIAIDEDLEAFANLPPAADGRSCRVIGGAERLPVASASIDLVICNHALEHFKELETALKEIARVLKPDGRLYIAVPDGQGFCDDAYRWIFEGGGHVNRFRREDLVRLVESVVGMRLAQWQNLYSSFNYLRGIADLLNAPRPDLQARLKWIARLPRDLIRTTQWELYMATRVVDRFLGTDLAIYGWALWFDRGDGAAVEKPPYVNVCMCCGTGHPPDPGHRLAWSCVNCGERNPVWFRWQP